MRILLVALLLSWAAAGADINRSLWALTAAHAADYASSLRIDGINYIELNPLVRGPNGEFRKYRGIAVKAGIVGATWAIEKWVVRKEPSAARWLSKVNWGLTIGVGAVAVRNRLP